jgi:hypothetical protein
MDAPPGIFEAPPGDFSGKGKGKAKSKDPLKVRARRKARKKVRRRACGKILGAHGVLGGAGTDGMLCSCAGICRYKQYWVPHAFPLCSEAKFSFAVLLDR